MSKLLDENSSDSDDPEFEMCGLGKILSKPDKTDEDAQEIYEEIRHMEFFKKFGQTFKNMEKEKIIEFCKNFTYEYFDQGKFIFKQNDPSNDKYYIIITGEVGVILSNKVGDWGKKYTVVKKSVQNTENHDQSHGKDPAENQDDPKRPTIIMGDVDDLRIDNSGHRFTITEIDSKSRANLHSKGKTLQRIEERGSLADLDEAQSQGSNSRPSISRPSMVGGIKKKSTSKRGSKSVIPEENEKEEEDIKIVLNEGPISKGTGNMLTVLKSVNKFSRVLNRKRQPEELKKQQKKEDSSESEDEAEQDFKKFAAKFGNLVRVMKPGEGFGELALTKNKPRSANILTKTAVEVMVLEKGPYEGFFGKIKKERDDFIKSSFPQMDEQISSSSNLNYLLFSFKGETFPKGKYIIREGKCQPKDAKFYLIQSGECIIEKNLPINLDNPYEKNKTLLTENQVTSVSTAGKGAFIGEEILESDMEFEYSVRVTSELCTVIWVTRRDFKYKFPKDFTEFVLDNFHSKKHHREKIYEIARKERLANFEGYKKDNLYCLKNVKLTDIIMKSSIQGLSKSMQRGHLVDPADPVYFSGLRTYRKVPDHIQQFNQSTKGSVSVRNIFHNNTKKEEMQRMIEGQKRDNTTFFDNHKEDPGQQVKDYLHMTVKQQPQDQPQSPGRIAAQFPKPRIIRSKRPDSNVDQYEAKVQFINQRYDTENVKKEDFQGKMHTFEEEKRRLHNAKFFHEQQDERAKRFMQHKLGTHHKDQQKYRGIIKFNNADLILNKYLGREEDPDVFQEKVDSLKPVFQTEVDIEHSLERNKNLTSLTLPNSSSLPFSQLNRQSYETNLRIKEARSESVNSIALNNDGFKATAVQYYSPRAKYSNSTDNFQLKIKNQRAIKKGVALTGTSLLTKSTNAGDKSTHTAFHTEGDQSNTAFVTSSSRYEINPNRIPEIKNPLKNLPQKSKVPNISVPSTIKENTTKEEYYNTKGETKATAINNKKKPVPPIPTRTHNGSVFDKSSQSPKAHTTPRNLTDRPKSQVKKASEMRKRLFKKTQKTGKSSQLMNETVQANVEGQKKYGASKDNNRAQTARNVGVENESSQANRPRTMIFDRGEQYYI